MLNRPARSAPLENLLEIKFLNPAPDLVDQKLQGGTSSLCFFFLNKSCSHPVGTRIWKLLGSNNQEHPISWSLLASSLPSTAQRRAGGHKNKISVLSFLTLAALGLCCSVQRFSSCGTRTQPFCSMWDLSSQTRDWTPVPTLEGRFLTTGPPEKSQN